jgi:4-carboxymuconolactone decarboxylase
MSQRIHLAAILARDERILLVRPSEGAPWELPGGPLLPGHEDVDAGMDAILEAMGVSAPAIEEDFLQTFFLPGEDGHLVFNLYAPAEWKGEPAPNGSEAAWFALDELEKVSMDDGVRDALLTALGLREPPDDALRLAAALREFGFDSLPPAHAPTPGSPPGSSRHEAGLDVLRTLTGAADAEAAGAAMAARLPELAGDVIDFALGEVWSDPALDRKTRSLQVVAMLSALGRTGPLEQHINGALNHGATPEQVVQTLRMVAVYAGFPAAIEAWPVMERVFDARGIARPWRPK